MKDQMHCASGVLDPPTTFPFHFEILHTSAISRARVGKIHTSHGVIDTPNFVAVGTNGTLKAVDNVTMCDMELQLMFCNTYHLLVHPGTGVIRKAGGLHRFIRRSMPIITDSGGFQVFSLAYGSVANELKGAGARKHAGAVLRIDEEGVLFRSYRDGNHILLTPETSIRAQKDLGADIIIPFDELPPYHIDPQALAYSLERTHRWEERSLREHLANPQGQAIYGVIHGGIDVGLRQKSCAFLRELPFDGFAIGGSVGKNQQEMHEMLRHTLPCLPETYPRHLLGIGDVISITRSIPLGVDTFDSSYPTRAARHGVVFTEDGPLDLTKNRYQEDFSPITFSCRCFSCTHYHRSFLHHLFKAKELTALTLTTLHNTYFMVDLMKKYRYMIANDNM